MTKNKLLKWISLLLLVLQNTALVLLMRVSRTSSGPMYLASSAVASMEAVKFIACLLVVFVQQNFNVLNFLSIIKSEVLDQPVEMIKLSIPSLLYIIQNNLLYYALSNLDAATYLLTYQLKILTTAVFSMTILKKSISFLEWVSLIILAIGVSLVQFSQESSKSEKTLTHEQYRFLGFLSVLLASITSGFSGVFFEKVLKGSTTSLWIRNIQLGTTSIILSFVGILINDLDKIEKNGFFYGYNSIVWSVVLLQALGGLVVAVVVKYADNILKGFAASISIVTACICSIFFFGFSPGMPFLMGTLLVNISVWMYARPKIKKDKIESQKNQETV